MPYLTQFDSTTWLHACDIIGVQDITQYHQSDEQESSLIAVALVTGATCYVHAPLKVVLMMIEEGRTDHDHNEEDEF